MTLLNTVGNTTATRSCSLWGSSTFLLLKIVPMITQVTNKRSSENYQNVINYDTLILNYNYWVECIAFKCLF